MWHGLYCSPGACIINLGYSEKPLLCRDLDRLWGLPGCCGWAMSCLAACTPGCVRLEASCASCQKKVPNSAWQPGTVLQEEMRSHFYHARCDSEVWLEKRRATQGLHVSSDLLERSEISECHRQSFSSCHPVKGAPSFSSTCCCEAVVC